MAMTPKEEYQLQQDLETYNATLRALYSAAFNYAYILLGLNVLFFVLLFVLHLMIWALLSISLTVGLVLYMIYLNIEALQNLVEHKDNPHIKTLKILFILIHILTAFNVVLMIYFGV